MALPVQQLEESFDLLAPRATELAHTFYRRLFTLAPEAEALFVNTDMERQKKVLLGTLGMMRKALRNLDAIIPVLQFLGHRHAEYGVRPEHYPLVGQALLESMTEVGGAAWRSEYTAAWLAVYQVVQHVMLSGVNQSFADPVVRLAREHGLATEESKDQMALEIHGRSRAMAHRAIANMERLAEMRARFHASMEALASDAPHTAAAPTRATDQARAPMPATLASAGLLATIMDEMYNRYLEAPALRGG